MRHVRLYSSLMLLATVAISTHADAQRRGGGGARGGGGFRGGGGGGFGGGSRSMARPSVSRPASRPSMPSRPSAPSMGNRPSSPIANRPDVGRPGGVGQVGNRPGDIGRPGGVGSNVDRNRDINRDINRDVNRNATRDIEHDHDWDWDNDYDGCCWHPFAAAAAVTAGAAITAAAIGSVTYALPADCSVTIVNGITYQNCAGTWYEPQFNGTTTTYIVVEPPQ